MFSLPIPQADIAFVPKTLNYGNTNKNRFTKMVEQKMVEHKMVEHKAYKQSKENLILALNGDNHKEIPKGKQAAYYLDRIAAEIGEELENNSFITFVMSVL